LEGGETTLKNLYNKYKKMRKKPTKKITTRGILKRVC